MVLVFSLRSLRLCVRVLFGFSNRSQFFAFSPNAYQNEYLPQTIPQVVMAAMSSFSCICFLDLSNLTA